MDTALSIVLVEDHAALRRVTAEVLRQEGHRVTELACAEDMEDEFGAQPADLFIIDLSLPGEDGLSLAGRLRAVQPGLGIIMLTARDQAEDMVAGFVTGADLYLVKPVDTQVLLAAIGALSRRFRSSSGEDVLRLESLSLHLRGVQGESHLSSGEARVLTGLARAPGQRLALFQVAELMGQSVEGFNKASLEVRMARLRKKLIEVGAPAGCLKALRNEGYQLCLSIHIR